MIRLILTLILASFIVYGSFILLEKDNISYEIKISILIFFFSLGALELSSFIIDIVFYVFNKGVL